MRFSEDDTILKDLVYLEEETGVGAGTPLERARRAVWGMLYADDAGVVSRSQEGLTRMMTIIVEVFGAFGLIVSERKTETLLMRAPEKQLKKGGSPPPPLVIEATESRSTNGEGGDVMIPFPGRSPKQTLPGIGLHDPLHGRQACPEFNSFYQGIGQICPQEELFSCRPLQKRGQICDPRPRQSLKDSGAKVRSDRPVPILGRPCQRRWRTHAGDRSPEQSSVGMHQEVLPGALRPAESPVETQGSIVQSGSDGGPTIRMHDVGPPPRPLPVTEEDTPPTTPAS